MLTEAEKKWLEERKVGMCCRCTHYYSDITDCGIGCQWIANKDFPMLQCFRFQHESYVIGEGNYKDAAEFEALTAAKVASLKEDEMPCYPNKLCPYKAKQIGSCHACYLRHSRIAVEAEMEQ